MKIYTFLLQALTFIKSCLSEPFGPCLWPAAVF